MEARSQRPKIVVGVDGSPESDAALKVAYDEALARQGELVVVHAWEFPPFGPSGDDRGRAEERAGRVGRTTAGDGRAGGPGRREAGRGRPSPGVAARGG